MALQCFNRKSDRVLPVVFHDGKTSQNFITSNVLEADLPEHLHIDHAPASDSNSKMYVFEFCLPVISIHQVRVLILPRLFLHD